MQEPRRVKKKQQDNCNLFQKIFFETLPLNGTPFPTMLLHCDFWSIFSLDAVSKTCNKKLQETDRTIDLWAQFCFRDDIDVNETKGAKGSFFYPNSNYFLLRSSDRCFQAAMSLDCTFGDLDRYLRTTLFRGDHASRFFIYSPNGLSQSEFSMSEMITHACGFEEPFTYNFDFGANEEMVISLSNQKLLIHPKFSFPVTCLQTEGMDLKIASTVHGPQTADVSLPALSNFICNLDGEMKIGKDHKHVPWFFCSNEGGDITSSDIVPHSLGNLDKYIRQMNNEFYHDYSLLYPKANGSWEMLDGRAQWVESKNDDSQEEEKEKIARSDFSFSTEFPNLAKFVCSKTSQRVEIGIQGQPMLVARKQTSIVCASPVGKRFQSLHEMFAYLDENLSPQKLKEFRQKERATKEKNKQQQQKKDMKFQAMPIEVQGRLFSLAKKGCQVSEDRTYFFSISYVQTPTAYIGETFNQGQHYVELTILVKWFGFTIGALCQDNQVKARLNCMLGHDPKSFPCYSWLVTDSYQRFCNPWSLQGSRGGPGVNFEVGDKVGVLVDEGEDLIGISLNGEWVKLWRGIGHHLERGMRFFLQINSLFMTDYGKPNNKYFESNLNPQIPPLPV